MSRVIWKYPLPKQSVGVITLPLGAEVLTVQTQNGWGCLWAVVDPDQVITVIQQVTIVGTGTDDQVPPTETYVGTFQVNWFVGHVFLAPEPAGLS